jgi:hypothetical protein
LLERIDARLARLEAQVARVEGAAGELPHVVATLADTFDSTVARLGERGIDVDARLHDALGLLERLTAPETMHAAQALLAHLQAIADLAASGVLDREPLHVISEAGRALAQASRHEPPRVGAFGALRALGDPDVQRALGFLLEVARGVGKSMATAPAPQLGGAGSGGAGAGAPPARPALPRTAE